MEEKPNCQATVVATTDSCDPGKWRRCELTLGHTGPHETTYCGRPYRWMKEKPIDLMLEFQDKYPLAAGDPLLKRLIQAVRDEEREEARRMK